MPVPIEARVFRNPAIRPAPEAVVGAAQDVSTIALGRVRSEGRLGVSAGRHQRVTLLHEPTNTIYQVTDKHVDTGDGQVSSAGWLDGDLHVMAIRRDPSGQQLPERAEYITLPRTTVTPDNVSHLTPRNGDDTGVQLADDIGTLAKHLDTAVVVPEDVFHSAHQDVYRAPTEHGKKLFRRKRGKENKKPTPKLVPMFS